MFSTAHPASDAAARSFTICTPNVTQAAVDRMPSSAALWLILVAGAVAWFARFLAVWALSEYGCISGVLGEGAVLTPVVAVSVVTVPFLAVAVGACLYSWRALRVSRTASPTGNQAVESTRFFAATGLVVNAVFTGVILAETLPVYFFLDQCRSFSMGM